MKTRGKVVAVCRSSEKGIAKTNIGGGYLLPDYGLKEDAHAGNWHRQVSLLAMESISKMCSKGLEVGPGDFAENITTKGLDLVSLPLGTFLRVGETLLQVTQRGKKCHKRCAIYRRAGECIMPREGVFARVIEGGLVKEGDEVWVSSNRLRRDDVWPDIPSGQI